MKKIFSCPNGHEVVIARDGRVECGACDLIATFVNRVDGIAKDWMPSDSYYESVRRLNDSMDEAFDNAYFGEW